MTLDFYASAQGHMLLAQAALVIALLQTCNNDCLRHASRREAKSIQDLNLNLEDLATTSAEIEEGSFPFHFFAALKDRLLAWFADAQNGVSDFFAKIGHFGRVNTDELCTTRSDGVEVCASADQLAVILAGTSAGAPASEVEAIAGIHRYIRPKAINRRRLPPTDLRKGIRSQ